MEEVFYVITTDNELFNAHVCSGYPKTDILCFYKVKIKAAFFGGFNTFLYCFRSILSIRVYQYMGVYSDTY